MAVLFYGGWDGLILSMVGRSYSIEGRTDLFYGGWDGLLLSRVGRSYSIEGGTVLFTSGLCI